LIHKERGLYRREESNAQKKGRAPCFKKRKGGTLRRKMEDLLGSLPNEGGKASRGTRVKDKRKTGKK